LSATRARITFLLVVAALATAPAVAAAAPAPTPQGLRAIPVRTVPAVAGIRITLGGRTVVTDSRGRARLLVPTRATRRTLVADGGLLQALELSGRPPRVAGVRLPDGGRVAFDRFRSGHDAVVALSTFYTFHPAFIGNNGRRIDPREVQSYTLKSRHGVRVTVKGAKPVELQASRVVSLRRRVVTKQIGWAVERVMLDGTNTVNRGQQRFYPARLRGTFPIELLFYRARFTSADAMFGFHVGSAIKLRYPDGTTRTYPFGRDGTVTLPALPRGEYTVDVDGPGFAPERPVALSRNQVVDLEVISYLDLALVGLGFAALLVGLVVARRPHLRSPARVWTHVAGLAAARRQATGREHATSSHARGSHRPTADVDHSLPPQQAREQVAETQ
jgi:hypothetical protein